MSEKVLLRTLGVLEAFAGDSRPLSMSDIAHLTATPAASCARLLRSLVRVGLLRELANGRRYCPTGRLATVAEALAGFNPWPALLAAELQRLGDSTGETVVLGVRQQLGVRTLAVVESTQSIRYCVQVGTTRPLHASAMGKALLAAIPESQRSTLLAQIDYEGYTPATLVSRAALEDDLAASRQRGWYTNLEETQPGVAALAAPLRAQRGGDEPLGIALVGPAARVAPGLEALGKQLRLACRRMEKVLREA
jgi:DNA-binding IclR family transcriptional regulator